MKRQPYMTCEQRMKLDQEAVAWFHALIYGFPCYFPDRWDGHPRSWESERRLEYHRLLKLEGAFRMSYKFGASPDGGVPPPRLGIECREGTQARGEGC